MSAVRHGGVFLGTPSGRYYREPPGAAAFDFIKQHAYNAG